MDRNKKIIKTSLLGIITNVVLVIFKALVGFFANSIAIILDAVNNLTDVLSSVITIVGAKLANKAPDKNRIFCICYYCCNSINCRCNSFKGIN